MSRFLLIFLVIVSLTLEACNGWLELGEPVLHVTVYNQTDKTLRIFYDGEVFIGETAPGVVVKFKTGLFSSYTITAKDTDGNTVYSTTLTQDDIGGGRGNRTLDVYFPSGETETVYPAGLNIIVSNWVKEPLSIYYNDFYVGQIKYGVELKFAVSAILSSYTITAKDAGEAIVYSKTFTPEELKEMKYLVEITRESTEN